MELGLCLIAAPYRVDVASYHALFLAAAIIKVAVGYVKQPVLVQPYNLCNIVRDKLNVAVRLYHGDLIAVTASEAGVDDQGFVGIH